ncbi:MAG: serine endoprotease DegQ, partial [Proteobacteria bacterium]|nr:serine endoprotease DegQ [Pseudomonadota bacterium]
GDLLICLGGRPIYTRPELQAILRGFAPGDSVEMDWIRDGARMEGSATLSESAVAGSRATSA